MQNKLRVHITDVKVNAPTYTNVTFRPSMINFFYGKNGTGKSTLAKAFKDGNAILTWDGAPFPKERILVYNEEFISKNVQSYGNIPGVFTISEANAEKKKLLDKKTTEKKSVDDSIEAKRKEATAKQWEKDRLYGDYIEAIWEASKDFRDKFPLALAYLRDKKKFADKVEGMTPNSPRIDPDAPFIDDEDMCMFADKNTEEEPLIEIKDIEALYQTVHGANHPDYCAYHLLPSTSLPESNLLSAPIISRSDTEFARFIRALGNLDWVTQGHTKYHSADGKCPYCQQTIPATFEDDLAACYDAEYKADLKKLSSFVWQYKEAINNVHKTVHANEGNTFPTPLQAEYKATFELFREKANANIILLDQKTANPADVITLADLSDLLVKLDQISHSINEDINARNAVLSDIPAQKKKCTDLVWNAIVQRTQVLTNTYRYNRNSVVTAINHINGEVNKLTDKSNFLKQEIAKLNSETVNTTKAMEDINHLLASAGFKGFELREKPSAKYVYELVRDVSGKKVVVNKDLSEGERHFIAFLYFYHTVMGSQSDDGKQVDKIVVIDDPVSSMDSSSLFVVASLTREMIAVCYNNYELNEESKDDHIRQFFCMTHNPYFFREISFNRLSDYECVSFFEIKKNGDNQTSIHECDDDGKLVGDGRINRSPVKNTYDALWDEYMHTDSPDTLMIVIRQILEYYFIQMVGYQNADLRKDLLNKKAFSKEDYAAASAMIAMINVGATGFNDGLYYDPSAADPAQLRGVFEKIFEVLGQEQHYNMMTRKGN